MSAYLVRFPVRYCPHLYYHHSCPRTTPLNCAPPRDLALLEGRGRDEHLLRVEGVVLVGYADAIAAFGGGVIARTDGAARGGMTKTMRRRTARPQPKNNQERKMDRYTQTERRTENKADGAALPEPVRSPRAS
jgi:hypothetical protein